MAIVNSFGSLKTALSRYMFHQRFVPDYDLATQTFEAVVNRRLRVRPMETSITLTTTNGETAIPPDYLAWRTVLPADRTRFPISNAEMDYVHPAYLPVTGINRYQPALFTIEGTTFKARPVNDAANAYEFHYYQRIPTINGNDNNGNWLLTAHPDLYLEGVLTELFVLGRNNESAQLHKARRDEVLAETIQLYALTTGATSPMMRTAEYF